MEEAKSGNLTTGVVWKQLLRFFLPIAAGTCIQQLYNAVDGLVVGRFVGTVALAAVGGSAANIINVLIGFFVALTTGASVVIAQIYGAGRTEDVQKASCNALAVCTLMGILLSAFGMVFAPWMLRILKTPENTIPDSLIYLRIYFAGVPFILVLNMESNMLRAVGDSYHPFVYMVISCVTNILLDFAFVLLFNWGVAGVAVATVAAQIINMILLTVRLSRPELEYRLNLKQLKLNGSYLSNMAKLGIPAGLQSSMYSVSNMIIQVGVNTLGTVVVASWAMTSKTDGVYWAVSNALGAAITTFIGQNVGARKFDRVKDCFKQGLLISVILSVLLSSGIMLVARPLLCVLTEDVDVIETTLIILNYFVPYYFTWSFVEVLSAVLRGSGDAVKPVIIIGLGICLFRVVWIFTVFRIWHTLFALSLAYVSSWVVTGTALMIYFFKGSWRKLVQNQLLENN